MSHQLTFANSEFSNKRRKMCKEIFLSRMDALLPWSQLLEVFESCYPKVGNGRCPYPLETMLRIHCMQQWYAHSDEVMEDTLYEIAFMRLFPHLALYGSIPDRATIMNFRHLVEKHKRARKIIIVVNRWLSDSCILMKQGTLVDATIIEAPNSTKNEDKQRDPELHQTKRGNQWFHGLKGHINVCVDYRRGQNNEQIHYS